MFHKLEIELTTQSYLHIYISKLVRSDGFSAAEKVESGMVNLISIYVHIPSYV